MADKYKYIITTKKSDFYNIQVIKDELYVKTENNPQVNRNTIPDRAVKRTEPTRLNPSGSLETNLIDLYSSRSLIAWLTREEAKNLKNDHRILGVETVASDPSQITEEYYPAFFGSNSPLLERNDKFYSSYKEEGGKISTSSLPPVEGAGTILISSDGYAEDSVTPYFSGSALESFTKFGNARGIKGAIFSPLGNTGNAISGPNSVFNSANTLQYDGLHPSRSLNWGLMAHSVSQEDFTKMLASSDVRNFNPSTVSSTAAGFETSVTGSVEGFDDDYLKTPGNIFSDPVSRNNPGYIQDFPELTVYNYTVDGSGVDLIIWENSEPRTIHAEFDRWHNKWNPIHPEESAEKDWGFLANYQYYDETTGEISFRGTQIGQKEDFAFTRFKASTLWTSGSYNAFTTSNLCNYNPWKGPSVVSMDSSCVGTIPTWMKGSWAGGNHSTRVASTAGGNLNGWAKNSDLFFIKSKGTRQVWSSENSFVNQTVDIIEGATMAAQAIAEFHRRKPIDPRTGFKRPTIVNASWSLYQQGHYRSFYGKPTNSNFENVPEDYKSNSHITELYYSGSLTTFEQPNEYFPSLEHGFTSTPKNNSSASFSLIENWFNTLWGGDGQYLGPWAHLGRLNYTSPSVDAAVEEMCDEGVIFIKTAGNNNIPGFRANLEDDDPNCEDFYKSIHYDNYFKLDIGFGNPADSTYVPAGEPIYYHRHPSPTCHKAISVGALRRGWGNKYTEGIHNNDMGWSPATYSSRGSCDIWAVADNTAAKSLTKNPLHVGLGFPPPIMESYINENGVIINTKHLGWKYDAEYGFISSNLTNSDPFQVGYFETPNSTSYPLGVNNDVPLNRLTDYVFKDAGAGTSFSAPQVAGIACLFFQLNPGADVNGFKRFMKKYNYPVNVSNHEKTGDKDNWVSTRTAGPLPLQFASYGNPNQDEIEHGVSLQPSINEGPQTNFRKYIPQDAKGFIDKDIFLGPSLDPNQADEGNIFYTNMPERSVMHEITQRFNSPPLYGSPPRAIQWPYATKADPITKIPVAGKMQGNVKIEGAVRFE